MGGGLLTMIDRLTAAVSDIHGQASVDSVYGAPIETNGRTVIPMAKIAYGFGGGFGSGTDTEAADGDEAPDHQGGGFGGGLAATPVGVVEITDNGTRIIRPTTAKRYVPIILGCFLVGYLLGKRH